MILASWAGTISVALAVAGLLVSLGSSVLVTILHSRRGPRELRAELEFHRKLGRWDRDLVARETDRARVEARTNRLYADEDYAAFREAIAERLERIEAGDTGDAAESAAELVELVKSHPGPGVQPA